MKEKADPEDISRFAEELSETRLRTYQINPHDVREHYETENSVLAGGYGYRQIFELVQNAVDAIFEDIESTGKSPEVARVHISLTGTRILAANTGAPLSRDGVIALLNAHSSPKRGTQIGRFGLGFKSLLRLGDKIEVLSTTGSLRFDPEACRNRIRETLGLPNDAPAPGMRLATAMSRQDEVESNPDLSEFDWATTMVKAGIREAGLHDHLATEIKDFPRESLLFLPTDIDLIFDVEGGQSRRLSRRRDGPDLVITDGDSESRWRVFEKTVEVNDVAAIDDATHIHQRERILISWAVPATHRDEGTGRFWAFFPTNSATRLLGILNAPWKLNSDRTGVIRGDWNSFLMKKAAMLVANSLPSLVDDDDPARALDAFPREMDRRGEVAAPLVHAVWKHLRSLSIIPDADGNLHKPSSLNLHPSDKASLAEQWSKTACGVHRLKLVHPRCLERDRLARLNTLAGQLQDEDHGLIDDHSRADSLRKLKRLSYAEWFRLATHDTVEEHRKTLQLAEMVLEDLPARDRRAQIQELKVVPVIGGAFAAPREAIFAPPEKTVPGLRCVDPKFASDPECYRIMAKVLEVRSLDDKAWIYAFRTLLEGQAYDAFWKSFRGAPKSVQTGFLRDSFREIQVKCADGAWHDHRATLRVGGIVTAEDADDPGLKSLVLDEDYHREDSDLLDELGVKDLPPAEWEEVQPLRREIPHDYNSGIRSWYCGRLASNQNPQWTHLRLLESFRMPRGWSLLPDLPDRPRARLTWHFLDIVNKDAGKLRHVGYGHSTRGDFYPTHQAPHPLSWCLDRYGVIECGEQTIPLATLRMARDGYGEVVAMIPGWESISHAIDICLSDWPEDLPSSAADFTSLWSALLALALAGQLSLDQAKSIYRLAARNGVLPDKVLTEHGSAALGDIYVTASREHARRAVDLGIRALSVDSETLGVWVKGGARRLEDLLRPDWAGETGPAVQLLEMFPEMATVLRANAADRLYARACENLRLELAGSASPIPCFAQEQVLLVDWEKLEAMSFHDRLKAVLREICAAGWSDRSLDDALRWILSDGSGARRRRVFEEPDLERRLLAAIGGRIEVLYETFDESVTDALDRKISDFQIASLALAIHGPTLLYLLRDSMESEGLKPPGRWGTSEAEQFVREIGFPNSFAASSQERHSPEIVVSGPFQLPPLHDFQEEIFHAIDSLMQKDDSRRRAVVSLPTGGGKTRVVVEAAVKLVLAKSGGGMKRSVLWVAQTNELCEQAVQCFRQVWSNHGSEGADLRIARLWGGSRSPREPEAEEAFVAVASIQTLNNRFDSELLTWLSHSSVVIVDECHHAIARSYSDLLRWLDATLGDQRRKDEVVEPVIIGLSATPFRGHDEDESNRLAARFDRRWLPRDHSGLYKTLRDMDVLARSNYEPLWYGGDFQFTEEERKEIEQFNEFPDTAAERLALDNARNDVIVKQVVESSCDSILLFANSVAHAKYLATRLHLAGVSAAAISSETKRAARRYFIRSFQEGKIRVLCNHSVLVAGFDAPKTDMILISRPVFSPVRYMQMVGRGLRGPANGGTPVCTILTVLDNLSEFQDRLPYEYCARFFSED